jgi:hypothetical protein
VKVLLYNYETLCPFILAKLIAWLGIALKLGFSKRPDSGMHILKILDLGETGVQ